FMRDGGKLGPPAPPAQVDDLFDGYTPPKTLGCWNLPPSLFAKRHLQADPVAVDLARPEGRLPDHPPEVLLRVGPLAERTQNPSGHERVEPPQPHFPDSGLDRLARCVFPQVVNHGLAARPQHPVHFADRLDRLAEVLEGGSAVDEIKGV